VQGVVCVTAEGDRSTHQEGVGCEGWRAVHTSIGVRVFMGMEAVSRVERGAGGGWRVEGKEGGCWGGGDRRWRWRACDEVATEGGRCWAGGAQNGATPLFMACYIGLGEVVKLLLADERVAVNQAMQVRVGGQGEGGWRERAGRAEGCGAGCSVCHSGGRQEHTSRGSRL